MENGYIFPTSVRHLEQLEKGKNDEFLVTFCILCNIEGKGGRIFSIRRQKYFYWESRLILYLRCLSHFTNIYSIRFYFQTQLNKRNGNFSFFPFIFWWMPGKAPFGQKRGKPR